MATEYEFHEAANIFPLDEEHLDELAADIKEHGQRYPIELLGGKIIDGRRRYLACQRDGMSPDFREAQKAAKDDPIAYVLSLNLHRRQLTASQAGVCAARAKDWYTKRAKERQKEHGGTAPGRSKTVVKNSTQVNPGKSRDQIGIAFGVSGWSVDAGTKVIEDGIPELQQAVDAGRLTLNKAKAIAGFPREEQKPLLVSRLSKGPRSPKAQKPDPTEGTDKHQFTEIFANNVADAAITQLKRIPVRNMYQDQAFDKVQNWIKKARTKS